METSAPTPRRTLSDWAALGGVAFVVLFVAGTALMFRGTPLGDDAPSKYIAYYGDSGNRDRIALGWALASLGVVAFLWFVAALRQAVRASDGDGTLAAVTTLGGSIYAALALVALALDQGVRTMSDDTSGHRVFAEVIHAADDASYVIHGTGGAALSAGILAASLAFRRSAVMPRWVAWAGFLAALAAFLTVFFVTTFVWMAWVVLVAAMIFARAGMAAATTAA